jgi:hypothetical protein
MISQSGTESTLKDCVKDCPGWLKLVIQDRLKKQQLKPLHANKPSRAADKYQHGTTIHWVQHAGAV